MNLDSVTSSFSSAFWLDEPRLSQLSRTGLKSEDARQVRDEVRRHLQKEQLGRAASWLGLGLRLGGDEFLGAIRRDGLLRPLRYRAPGSVGKVCHLVLKFAENVGLTETNRAYFETIRNLSTVAVEVARQRATLVTFLRHRGPVSLKSFLAAVDLFFMKPWSYNPVRLRADYLEFYSKEEIAEGLSLIWYLYASEVGLPPSGTLVGVDCPGLIAHDYDSLLADACRIRAFQEWEMLVDVLGYSLRQTSDFSFCLDCSDVRLAQSYHLGFHQTTMMMTGSAKAYEDDRTLLSLRDWALALHREVGDKLAVLIERPPHFVYQFPQDDAFWAPLKDPRLFREEVALIHCLSNENYLWSADKILDFRLSDYASVRDVMMAWRVFAYLEAYVTKHLSNYIDRDRALVFRRSACGRRARRRDASLAPA